jgi:hypothetical protein
MAKKIIVGRPINGLSINGLEYLLDDKGEIMRFDTAEAAREYLFSQGMPLCLIHGDYFIFEEDGDNE